MNQSKDEADAEVAGSRILVIDDEEVVHLSLRRMLGRKGHEVDTELSAKGALERLSNVKYDLVISDLMMPEMNGLELLEHLEKEEHAPPVLMITGYPTIRTAVQALRLGAVDYIAKPFSRQELLGPVNRALRRVRPAHDNASALDDPNADGFETPDAAPSPGDRFVLRGHSWAVYQQDGTMEIGIASAFLETIGEIEAAELPAESTLVEQGHTGFRLTTAGNEEHTVFMPLSGSVLAVNRELEAEPSRISADTWLVRLVPERLDEELELLERAS